MIRRTRLTRLHHIHIIHHRLKAVQALKGLHMLHRRPQDLHRRRRELRIILRQPWCLKTFITEGLWKTTLP